jgi:error-prone DNA polymerase
VRAWLKRHHPAAFLAALLNSQPMGFYAPAQLVRDARAHGVQVRPVDVRCSEWDSVLEGSRERLEEGPEEGPKEGRALGQEQMRAQGSGRGQTAGAGQGREPGQRPVPVPGPALRPVRLGLNRISGFPQAAAERLCAARAQAPFASPEDLARRAALDAHELALLAGADALAGLAGHRHQAAWAVAGVDTRATALLRQTRTHEAPAVLAPPDAAARTLADYRALGLTLGAHPVALLREALAAYRVQPAAVLADFPHGRLARASGLVTHRQRPETARGVVFVTLEDETGAVNVIVWPQLVEAQRRPLLGATLLTVYGIWQRQGEAGREVRHLVARQLVDHTPLLQGLASREPQLPLSPDVDSPVDCPRLAKGRATGPARPAGLSPDVDSPVDCPRLAKGRATGPARPAGLSPGAATIQRRSGVRSPASTRALPTTDHAVPAVPRQDPGLRDPACPPPWRRRPPSRCSPPAPPS